MYALTIAFSVRLHREMMEEALRRRFWEFVVGAFSPTSSCCRPFC